MKLKLLEIGAQTELLSACRLSLLLGVFTADNRVADFLKFARNVIQSQYAILMFKHEPYIWFSSDEGCRPFLADLNDQLDAFFTDTDLLTQAHPQYAALSAHMTQLGAVHSRLVAIDLIDQESSVGSVVFFDEVPTDFDLQHIEIVHGLSRALMNVIRLRLENTQLKEKLEEQEALNFSKTKFFQIIAHDLRAPFHGLVGFADVLANEPDSLDAAAKQEISEYLYDTAQSTYNLLEGLLNWAMAEGGRLSYHPINFKLKQSTHIVSSVLSSLAVKKNIALIDEVPPDTKVYADINMITSVIQNLVSNALKFSHTDGSGKVTLSAELDQQHEAVHLYIVDNGLGMTPQQIDSLFHPNVTVSQKGTAGEKGTGLGLVLCKRFIDLNHGYIAVRSKQGQGTTFKVTLPAATHHHQALIQSEAQ